MASLQRITFAVTLEYYPQHDREIEQMCRHLAEAVDNGPLSYLGTPSDVLVEVLSESETYIEDEENYYDDYELDSELEYDWDAEDFDYE